MCIRDRESLAKELNITIEELNNRVDQLHENNPMMGHRGVRVGITYPEITEMQVRAILEAAAELIKEGKNPKPEIMIPVTAIETELQNQLEIVEKVYEEVKIKYNMNEIPYELSLIHILMETILNVGLNDITREGLIKKTNNPRFVYDSQRCV